MCLGERKIPTRQPLNKVDTFHKQGGVHENNDSRRMHNCGIFPLLILPQLPGTLTLAF